MKPAFAKADKYSFETHVETLIRFIICILVVLFTLPSQGQTLRGTVVDGTSGKALSAVAVFNGSNKQYAYSDTKGSFSISAKKGDQVSFSFVGYKTQVKTVPAAIGTAVMRIELFPLSYELEEFVYHPLYTPYQQDSIARKSTYQRALARQHGGSVMSPVTFLAERLSKRSQQIFRFQKSFNYWEDQKFIESRYSSELVQQLTGLKGDTLAYFMNANPMPYDYARVASELELKIWIREHFREWQKNPHYPSDLPPVDSATVDSQ